VKNKRKYYVSDSLLCGLLDVLIITKFRNDLFNNYLCTMRTGRSPTNLISTFRSSSVYYCTILKKQIFLICLQLKM